VAAESKAGAFCPLSVAEESKESLKLFDSSPPVTLEVAGSSPVAPAITKSGIWPSFLALQFDCENPGNGQRSAGGVAVRSAFGPCRHPRAARSGTSISSAAAALLKAMADPSGTGLHPIMAVLVADGGHMLRVRVRKITFTDTVY
jgi:hypothetical protein